MEVDSFLTFEDFMKNKENVTLEMLINRINELESKLEKPIEPTKPDEPIDYMYNYFNEVIK